MNRYAAEIRDLNAYRSAQHGYERGAKPDDDFDEFYDEEEVARHNDDLRIESAIADAAFQENYA